MIGLDRIAIGRIDDVGRSQVHRSLEFVFRNVDGDDPQRAGDPGTLNNAKSNTTCAKDRDGGARFNLGGVEGRADTGGDAASDERGAFERHVFPDLDHAVFVHQHLLGVGCEIGHLDEWLAIQ